MTLSGVHAIFLKNHLQYKPLGNHCPVLSCPTWLSFTLGAQPAWSDAEHALSEEHSAEEPKQAVTSASTLHPSPSTVLVFLLTLTDRNTRERCVDYAHAEAHLPSVLCLGVKLRWLELRSQLLWTTWLTPKRKIREITERYPTVFRFLRTKAKTGRMQMPKRK